jgi:hypothetical protein
MKINKFMYGPQITNKGSGLNDSQSTESFKNILANRIHSVSETIETENTTKAAEISNNQIPPALRIEGLSLTETSLNTLDSFSKALGDTKFSNEDIEPFVAALEEETNSLIAVKNQLPPDDPLYKLLDRVATVTYLETAKFRRGDYDA